MKYNGDSIRMTEQKKTKHQYVNNQDFLQALIDYQKTVNDAKKQNLPNPKIPDYIGDCFYKIAVGIAKRPNFCQYTYKDEMIGDAVENCLMYFHNFDPTKYDKPFAYFSKVIWWAFVRRIDKEKKQQYIKYKCTENFGILGEEEMEELEDSAFTQMQVYDTMYDFIEKFENNMKEKKKKITKQKGIDSFIE